VATLAQQTTTVKPRGGKTAGQAGCIAPRVWSDCERLFHFLRCDPCGLTAIGPKAAGDHVEDGIRANWGRWRPAYTAMIYSRGMSEQAREMRRQASVL
jgi:hypothetical protein